MFLLLSCFLPNPTTAQMEWHYEDLGAARDAVVQGDLAAYHEAMQLLGERTPVPTLDLGQDELVERIRQARKAETIPDAGQQIGHVVAACASCHSRQGVTPRVDERGDPPADDQVMARHAWGVEAIFDGMVLGDVSAIERGALVLDFTPTVVMGGEADALQDTLHDHASDVARVGATYDERGEAYGELLGTCASCHAHTGGGPR